MKILQTNTRPSSSGFTLAEMAVSMAIIVVIIGGVFNVFVDSLYSYNTTTLMRNAAVRTSMALDRMVIGVGTNAGLREASSSDVSLTLSNGNSDWWLSYSNVVYHYTSAKKIISDQSGKTICTNVISSTASNFSGGCKISVSVAESGGGRTVTNTMNTFVEFRN